MKPAAAPADTYTDGFFVDEVSDLLTISRKARGAEKNSRTRKKKDTSHKAPTFIIWVLSLALALSINNKQKPSFISLIFSSRFLDS
jgi:hypothetical protein